jgi:aminodeoxychorismate synthase component I
VAAVAVHELSRAASLLPVAARLRRRAGSFWLDSALAGGRLGRFSYAGAEPYAVARGFGDALEVECLRAARPDLAAGRTRARGELLSLLAPLLAPRPLAHDGLAPPFVGGAVGWLGYELAAQLEPALGLRARDDLGLPDLAFLLVDRVVALEHGTGRRFACALGFAGSAAEARARAADALDAWCADLASLGDGDGAERGRADAAATARGRAPDLGAEGAHAGRDAARVARAEAAPLEEESSLDAAAYRKAVEQLLDHIGCGDVYQACLTRRIARPFAGDPWRLYLALRAASPAPFGAWLALPELTLLSTSPERFLALDADGRVESRPIKGTRPRGADPGRDRALARELAASEKDRAENLMIVDLVRHDLGRVCATGSVEVAELAAVESYATVHHLVSTVRGRLRPGADAFDLLRAAFPPGSMTGAPKLAAMRLLDRLEPVRRGPYAGALGYLDARGGASLSVVIRTALLRAGRAFVHTGGGVVADSDPAAEWRESEDKARALLRAIEGTVGDAEPGFGDGVA